MERSNYSYALVIEANGQLLINDSVVPVPGDGEVLRWALGEVNELYRQYYATAPGSMTISVKDRRPGGMDRRITVASPEHEVTIEGLLARRSHPGPAAAIPPSQPRDPGDDDTVVRADVTMRRPSQLPFAEPQGPSSPARPTVPAAGPAPGPHGPAMPPVSGPPQQPVAQGPERATFVAAAPGPEPSQQSLPTPPRGDETGPGSETAAAPAPAAVDVLDPGAPEHEPAEQEAPPKKRWGLWRRNTKKLPPTVTTPPPSPAQQRQARMEARAQQAGWVKADDEDSRPRISEVSDEEVKGIATKRTTMYLVIGLVVLAVLVAAIQMLTSTNTYEAICVDQRTLTRAENAVGCEDEMDTNHRWFYIPASDDPLPGPGDSIDTDDGSFDTPSEGSTVNRHDA